MGRDAPVRVPPHSGAESHAAGLVLHARWPSGSRRSRPVAPERGRAPAPGPRRRGRSPATAQRTAPSRPRSRPATPGEPRGAISRPAARERRRRPALGGPPHWRGSWSLGSVRWLMGLRGHVRVEQRTRHAQTPMGAVDVDPAALGAVLRDNEHVVVAHDLARAVDRDRPTANRQALVAQRADANRKLRAAQPRRRWRGWAPAWSGVRGHSPRPRRASTTVRRPGRDGPQPACRASPRARPVCAPATARRPVLRVPRPSLRARRGRPRRG